MTKVETISAKKLDGNGKEYAVYQDWVNFEALLKLTELMPDVFGNPATSQSFSRVGSFSAHVAWYE